MSEDAVKTNDNMPLYAYKIFKNLLKNKDYKNIYLLGVSYAPDVGDTRYSPVELFASLLIDDGFNVVAHDPYVNYWEELDIYISGDFKELNHAIDSIVITTAHSSYRDNKKMIQMIMKLDQLLIFDTVGVLNEKEICTLSDKHIVYVLGRGDLESN